MILPVKMKDFTYDVVVQKNSLDIIEEYLDLNRKVLILTDDGIPYEYIDKVYKKCFKPYVYTILQGEASKSFINFEKILDFLIKNEFSRTDCVIAVGGGVVGDLAGFVSSVYMRGIPFYNIPTTLLSQVDSSIGGKTAIDKLGIKNIIGAFYPPHKVIIDPTVLKTLDKRQLYSGLAESIKMGLTCDKTLFNLIKDSTNLLEDIETIIIKSLQVKKDVVELDPNELGLRRVLNFGHTIGHGIESHSGALLHGECVGIGMTYMCSDNVKKELLTVLNKYDLPTQYIANKEELYKYICLDKKRNNNKLVIVSVNKIGEFEFKEIFIEEILNYF
ncbi:MAG: 3-dehydroquinate synthase [Bacilli bacterium]|nr:3-dehydroquinate synthase [Bacilli bacterium]